MISRIIDFITFVGLPIRKKFLLFSIGVLFWFLAIFVMSEATLYDINRRSTNIVDSIVPQDRIAQKTTRKLQSLHVDAVEIMDATNPEFVRQRTVVSTARLKDIDTFLAAFGRGGRVHDYSRDNNELIESFEVLPVTQNQEGHRYVQELSALTETLGLTFDELARIKLELLQGNVEEAGALTGVYQELKEDLAEARTLSNRFSAKSAYLYQVQAQKIKDAVHCTASAVVVVLVIATALLALFTIWISRSLANPINSMIKQIHALGEGTADLSKKLTVSTKDEIGKLSSEFNGLMESIHRMATFKKVIEEDDTLDDVYHRLGREFRDVIGLEEFSILEVEKNSKKMKAAYPFLLPHEEIHCHEDILINSDLCRAKKTGHPVSSLSYPEMCRHFRADTGKEHICLPMIVGGSTGGVVQFLFDRNGQDKMHTDAIDRRIFAAAQYIKESLSVIEAKKLMNTLRESAIKDSLTGLYNRRFLQDYTETLVAGTLRRGKAIGLIMCDLDYFKQVNDTYGHDVGDAILRETAATLTECVRKNDFVLRFGGEEFLVLLVDVEEGETLTIADKIRTSMAAKKLKVPDGTLSKTISLGVSEFPTDSQGFWQAIKFADVALYEAKNSGRNRTVRFASEMWTEAKF